MAIFHASTKPIARSAGRSSVAAAAYRAGCELVDERTGLTHDYTKKCGIASTEILTPDGLGAERNALWNAAETAEKRKDARTAREWIIALPSELNANQRQALAHTFGVKLVERFGVAVDIAIHQPDRKGDNRNNHAHLLTTTRQVWRDGTGALVMGEKATIELSDKARRERGLSNAADEISAIRQLWEQTANQALEQAGRSERIDHRSFKAQGIDREATTHLGPVASAMERRGVASDRGDGNRQAQANNQERQRLSAQIIDLQAERQKRAHPELARKNAVNAVVRGKSGLGQALAQAAAESPQQPAETAFRPETERPPAKPELSLIERAEQTQAQLFKEVRETWQQETASRYRRQADDLTQQYWKLREEEPKEPLMPWKKKDWARRHGYWVDQVNSLAGEIKDKQHIAQVIGSGNFEADPQQLWNWSQHAQERLEAEYPQLAQAVKDAQLAAQEKARQERAADKAISDFKTLAIKRDGKFLGYRDGGKQWEALPETLKTMIENFNSQPKEARGIILERMRDNLKRTPGATEKFTQQMEQGREQDRDYGPSL